MPNYTEVSQPNLVINTLDDASKLDQITVGENEIILVPDDTQTQLDGKVDKSSGSNKVYGTNAVGAQIVYDRADFQNKLTAGNNLTIDQATNTIDAEDKTLVSFVIWEDDTPTPGE